MTSSSQRFDAVVAGAGTAGCACALQLARAGLRVALLEARPLDRAGARWCNQVPSWMFEAAGIGPPRAPELRGRPPAFVLDAGAAHTRIELRPAPLLTVDVRLLIKRLQVLCRQAGVQVMDQTRAGRLRLAGGRAVELAVRGRAAGPGSLRAALFIDATGLAGVLRRHVPALARTCPPLPAWHTCSAAQQVCAIADRAGARAFLERNRLEPGAVLAHTGVDGGYAVTSLAVAEDLCTVELLAGAAADGRHASGPSLLRQLKARTPWIGQRLFGGSGWIPLRRPCDRLTAPGIALVGDAGCQVCPAHGSGTGTGLVAARLLAQAVEGSADPGDRQTLWNYACHYQRQLGALGAAYDALRRYCQGLSGPEAASLAGSGALTTGMLWAALGQQMPAAAPRDALRVLAGAPHRARLLAAAVRMGAARQLYARYPETPDPRYLRAWSGLAGLIFARPRERA